MVGEAAGKGEEAASADARTQSWEGEEARVAAASRRQDGLGHRALSPAVRTLDTVFRMMGSSQRLWVGIDESWVVF